MNRLWRPFSAPGEAAPMRLVRGEGCRVVAADGRRYLDAAGGLWNLALGLGQDELIQAMQRQLVELSFGALFHASHAPAEQLCEQLARRVPLDGEPAAAVYLSTTGSTAVEVALRGARLHHQVRGQPRRTGIVSFDRAYHGSSALGLGASGLLAADLGEHGRVPGCWHLPSPPYEDDALIAFEQLLAERADELACLLLEPVLGSAGVVVPTPALCARLSALCRHHGLLLVADEVATGAGRCGAFLASQRLGLEPDIVALSKGLNAGYFPLGATASSRRVVAPIEAARQPLQFGSTQDGNPVGCVSALATLDRLDRDALPQRADVLGTRLMAALREACAGTVLAGVRGLGLMIGLPLAHDGGDGAVFTAAEAEAVRRQCQDEGLLVYPFDHGISLFPPLTLGDDDAVELVEVLAEVLGRQV